VRVLQTAAAPPQDDSLNLDRTARTQLSVLLGCGMVAQMGIGMIVPLLPAYCERIGLAAGGVGIIVALPSVARLLLNLPLGALADSSGRKYAYCISTTAHARRT
jgi:DHA1 family multidrug resistance protein-like MFS transporter